VFYANNYCFKATYEEKETTGYAKTHGSPTTPNRGQRSPTQGNEAQHRATKTNEGRIEGPNGGETAVWTQGLETRPRLESLVLIFFSFFFVLY
jgi:hypothetical protein